MKELAYVNLWSNPSSKPAYPMAFFPKGQENLSDGRKECWSSDSYYQVAKCGFITPEFFPIALETVRRERHGGWCWVMSGPRPLTAGYSSKVQEAKASHNAPSTGTQHIALSSFPNTPADIFLGACAKDRVWFGMRSILLELDMPFQRNDTVGSLG